MKRTTKGILWIVLPFLILTATLIIWPLLSFVFSSVLATNENPSAGAVATLQIVNMVLGFFGIASIIMVPIGFVVGVVTLMKKDEPSSMPPTEPPPSSSPNMMS